MTLKPLGHRMVVLPDRPVTETESGLYIPDAYQNQPAMSGIVQRVGDGPERDRRLRSKAIARCMQILDDAEVESATLTEALILARDEMSRYLRDVAELEHIAEVGQRVIFPMEAGHEIVLGEDTEGAMVIVSEDSILAVYDNEEAAA